jgi:2-C-methyl-D-erythritol 4-phosphate cytidylyltransferase/2-C-methyl-D-erythritol 2,4-cyclodiphosphate synthase
MHSVATVVVAAGEGRRLGAGLPKALVPLLGKPLFVRSLEALAGVPGLVGQVLVVPAGEEERFRAALGADAAALRVVAVVAGGARRQDSAAAGFAAVPADTDVILIHDAARPLVPAADVAAVAAAAARDGAAIAVAPVTDTLKRVAADGSSVRETVPRAHLRRALTPQGFRRAVYAAALARAVAEGWDVTDDASMVERAGGSVTLVDADGRNLKVTTPEDLAMAATLLGAGGGAATRVGHGWDRHRLVEGRPLRLGGVAVPFGKGLLGHSDGDVLLHAVADAVLGAAGLGDLGDHFPSTDARWKDGDSATFLRHAVAAAAAAGWAPCNVDATVIAEEPRLGPHRAAMTASLAALLGLRAEDVNVKAKSAEGLGPVGTGEAMEAHAVVLLRAMSAGRGASS